MNTLESLSMSKFEILTPSKLNTIAGGAVAGRTRTVVHAQTAAECEDCRKDSKKEVTVRKDD